MHAGADVICLTPICPHSLSFRPVILPKSATVKIVLPEVARTSAWVTFDGQARFKMQRQEALVIHQSSFCVPFVRWTNENFDEKWVQRLDKTLKWNKQIV